MKVQRVLCLAMIAFVSQVSLAARLTPQAEAKATKEAEATAGATEINLGILNNRSLDDLTKVAFEKENPYEFRWSALQRISTDYPQQAEEILLKAADQTEWYMKNAALLGLQEIGSKKTSEIARKLISDDALVVRSMAVSVLAKNHTPETRQLFWSELKKKYNFKRNQSLWIRYQILEHLAEEPQKSEREKFLELINEKDKKIQSISKNVIIKIQTKAFR